MAAAAAGRILRTASAIVSKPSATSHVLRIDGYSHLAGALPCGEYADSCAFDDAGGHTWRLLLYPNGYSDEHEGHVGVFLQLTGGRGRVRARPWFSLLDSAGKPGPSRDAGAHAFSCHGDPWGFMDFISREELEGSEYLRGDCVAIQCDLALTTVRKCHDDPVLIAQNIVD
ncbi:BTB/POZ and MATH domain-containing protein 6-like [Oryza brachyantha]|uniref:MATH domain-containing protein n=1 Tax=Oryza brachyantha TaxID=4533 RepID=J3N9Q8_ORYBR|nr:BTB/POZ and MATH domain-containing protein 6-like [Oryza brachyantha]